MQLDAIALKGLQATISAAYAGMHGDGVDALLIEVYEQYKRDCEGASNKRKLALQVELRYKCLAIMPPFAPLEDAIAARDAALEQVRHKLPPHILAFIQP